MVEALFLLACLLIYLFSFLYRTMALVASALTVWIAFLVDANVIFVLGMIITLAIIRLNKSGIKDEF